MKSVRCSLQTHSDEVTIRSSIVNADLSVKEVLSEIVTVWKEGIFHADGVHTKLVMHIAFLVA